MILPQRKALIFRRAQALKAYNSGTPIGLIESLLFCIIAAETFAVFPISTISFSPFFPSLAPWLSKKELISTGDLFDYWIALPGLLCLFLLIFAYHFNMARVIPEGQLSKMAGVCLLIGYSVLLGIVFDHSYLWLVCAGIILFGYWARTFVMAKNLSKYLNSSVPPMDQIDLIRKLSTIEYTANKAIIENRGTEDQISNLLAGAIDLRLRVHDLARNVTSLPIDELESWQRQAEQIPQFINKKNMAIAEFINNSTLVKMLGSGEKDAPIMTNGLWRKRILFGAIASFIFGGVDWVIQAFIIGAASYSWLGDIPARVQIGIHIAASLFLLFVVTCGGIAKIFRGEYSIFTNLKSYIVDTWKINVRSSPRRKALFIVNAIVCMCLALYPIWNPVNWWYYTIIVIIAVIIVPLVQAIISGYATNSLYEGHLVQYSNDIDNFCSRFVFAIKVYR